MSKQDAIEWFDQVKTNWQQMIAEYSTADNKKAVWQLVNSFGPYIGIWCLMPFALQVSYWLVLPLAVIAAGFLVRIFIIMHDCGHQSFFKSKKANDITGYIAGVFTFTPYRKWTKEHAIHHGTSGNLDKRGTGDVWTMTVKEYMSSGFWKRLGYKAFRHPLFLFILAPFLMFVIDYRFSYGKTNTPANRMSVRMNNLGLALIFLIGTYTMGLKVFTLIMLPIIWIAAIAGVWLFYVQHQYEDTYWEAHDHWDFVKGALEGSSFYKLPKVLQFFTGNIGFHHIHHLSPLVPNYLLEKCHKANPLFEKIKPLTFWQSFKSASLRLWDEEKQRMLSFKEFRQLRRAGAFG